MSKFQPNITNIHFEKGEFRFNLSGTETYGLDKSFMNAIRRVLLTDIPTVAFRVDENKEKDITINTNSGSIHNEILIQRIGLLHLYINPDTKIRLNLWEVGSSYKGLGKDYCSDAKIAIIFKDILNEVAPIDVALNMPKLSLYTLSLYFISDGLKTSIVSDVLMYPDF